MLISAAVPVLEAALAFLALDLIFRLVPLQPDSLRKHLRAYQGAYMLVALTACLAGAGIQWKQGRWGGLLLSVLNLLPWWLLWRFGLRKQFTYLFKDDGGRPRNRVGGGG